MQDNRAARNRAPSAGESDVAALIASACLPRIPGWTMDLHLVEPDRQAWHLRIQCAQPSTNHCLPLEIGAADVRMAVIRHTAAKIHAAGRC